MAFTMLDFADSCDGHDWLLADDADQRISEEHGISLLHPVTGLD